MIGEHDDHGMRSHASGDEPQAQRGGLVEPLPVVHHDEHGLPLGESAEQRQHGRPDHQAVRRLTAQPERRTHSGGLGRRQQLDTIGQRSQQPVQPRESQVRLGPGGRVAQPDEARGLAMHVAKQS